MQSSLSQTPPWYVIHTKPHQEYAVSDLLQRRGLRTYLPCLEKTVHRRRHPQRPSPFFRGYLFAQVDWNEVPLSSINWAPGVNSVVRYGGVPAHVDDTVIRWLQERLARIEGSDYLRGQPLRLGDRLQVTKGPLKGLEVVFDERLSSTDRARVFIEVLGRLTACQVDIRSLEWA